MTSLRNRKPAPIIVLLLAVYAAAFLLHDLTHYRFQPTVGPGAGPITLFGNAAADGSSGDALADTAQGRHHCPFCNGFTGSILVSPLSPPVTAGQRPALPVAEPDHGLPWPSSIARAPPVA